MAMMYKSNSIPIGWSWKHFLHDWYSKINWVHYVLVVLQSIKLILVRNLHNSKNKHLLKNSMPKSSYTPRFWLDSVKDFLIKLGIKPRMHLWGISIFSIKHVIVRPTKIMNWADKNWAHFYKIKYLKNQNILIKVGLLKVS